MRRRFILCALPALLFACQNPYSYDYYKRFFLKPYDKTEMETVELRKISAWVKGTSPDTAKTVGYLERCRVRVAGTRGEEEFSFIRSHPDFLIVGKVTETGDIYRYDDRHDLKYVGNYQVETLGLKIFFNLPLDRVVRLDVPEQE